MLRVLKRNEKKNLQIERKQEKLSEASEDMKTIQLLKEEIKFSFEV